MNEGDAEVATADDDLDLSDMPAVAHLCPLFSEDHSQEEFEVSLETLLDRLDQELSPRSPGSRS